MSPTLWSIAIRLLELLIGGIMVISAWLHLQNSMLFYVHVAQYRIVPTALLPFFVQTMPWLLLFTGMMIIGHCGQPSTCLVGAVIFLLFTLGQLWVMWKGYDIECGCFGSVLQEKIGIASILKPATLFL